MRKPGGWRCSPSDANWDMAQEADSDFNPAKGRVGLGGFPPRPPTDPDVRTLAHPVPLMMDSPFSDAECPDCNPGSLRGYVIPTTMPRT